jgi:hypothetical protein
MTIPLISAAIIVVGLAIAFWNRRKKLPRPTGEIYVPKNESDVPF